MGIKIKIGKSQKVDPFVRKFELKIRKSLDGNLMIFDHADIDIVVMPSKNKVLALPKETMGDAVYGAQNRLFSHLRRKGLIAMDSIQASNIYGSMEALMAENEQVDPVKMILMNIDKFIDEERP
jgi:hypothetical protein